MIELDISGTQTIGTRAEQQDTATMLHLSGRNDRALLVVADGLGGQMDGSIAAGIVAETFRKRAGEGAFDEPTRIRHALDDVLFETNRSILASRKPEDEGRGSASTAVAAIISEGRLRWISVGDSHLYLWRRGKLVKLNADHSQAGMLVRQGRSPDDPEVKAVRSLLTSALTGDEIDEIDSPENDVPLATGDVVLLASDGLNTLEAGVVSERITQTREHGAEAVANDLVTSVLARELQKQDNVTVVVACVGGTGAPATADDDVPVQAPLLPPAVEAPAPRWHLAAGLVLIVVILASVIMTQMQ